MLDIKQLKFTYHDQSKDKKFGDLPMCFNLQVNKGEILSLIGASGSGKTTMLNLIAGFNQAESGQIIINGNDITQQPIANRPVTTVFQAHNLFPHLDVYTNVAIGIKPSLKLDTSEVNQVQESLHSVGLEALAKKRPSQLSGGQQQRVALARALVRQQQVLLLDEPLAALGPAMREEIIELIKKLVTKKEMMAILVSHQPSDALQASERVAFIHQGEVLSIGESKALLENPIHKEIQDYLGVLKGELH